MKKSFEKYLRDHVCGGGGFGCRCCFTPDRKQRKQFVRKIRKTLTRLLDRIEAQEAEVRDGR